MTTEMKKVWFVDGQIIEQEIPESEIYKQEPVAWWIPKYKAPDMVSKVRWSDECEPLYTRPAQRTWVGLTDEEIWSVLQFRGYNMETIEIAKAIEAKLKEKNT